METQDAQIAREYEEIAGHSGETADAQERMEQLRRLKAAEHVAPEDASMQIIVVALNHALFGIRIFSVREILRVPNITRLPCSPAYIAGVISVRGDIQAVVHLKTFLQLGVSPLTEQSRIILVESGELTAGLLVDEMLDILTLPERMMLPLNEAGMMSTHAYLVGKCEWNGRMISLLDIEAILQGIIVDQT